MKGIFFILSLDEMHLCLLSISFNCIMFAFDVTMFNGSIDVYISITLTGLVFAPFFIVLSPFCFILLATTTWGRFFVSE